ncbi:MAG: Methyltransferase domain protein [Candidatus Nomurabacteria bacterium GW2011_GWF1_31_48]|uniref:Methyltransferase domain protein n=2 Tax=Patescibacteria group TaxID=1783273 RepID=A0A0G1PC70_9BACT|nr:MAG: Methyltransferase domain protein [Candidatus Nomurabacteria bacterium GW2011_GWF1_31_48]KKU30341.1 MAG: Methyltransferase domain protein [Candidatus Collierbacteria bacterium GW2011_GWE1_46_18]HCR36163.1 hypothetical protein [Candidatus Woesebacteria bacterium]
MSSELNKKKISRYKKANLGCGNKKINKYINIDNNKNCRPDMIIDLNKLPYPFKDNTFEEIYAHHVLEHLDRPMDIINEWYRVSKDKAILKIFTPHFSYNWQHPGHVSAISSRLFNYFGTNSEDKEIYGKSKFKVRKIILRWMTNYSMNNPLVIISNKIINYLANLNIKFTERIWCYWVGGFEEIYFEVEVAK